jgi:hypothetical protein
MVPDILRAHVPSGGGYLVSSALSAATAFGRQVEGLATSSVTAMSSTKTSWMNRKSSFRAAARTIRSVSVTTMAAVSGGQDPKCVHDHHRVSSVKSAGASIMRKNTPTSSIAMDTGSQHQSSQSVPTHLCNEENERMAGIVALMQGMTLPTASPTSELRTIASSTNSSHSTATSYDNTSQSMPPLESEQKAVFDLSYDDSSLDSSLASLPSEDLPLGSLPASLDDTEKKCEDEFDYQMVDDAYANETEWAQEALKLRLDKGRVDSSCNNEVTFLNTFLNKNLSLTNEGNAIRRRIADDTDSINRQTNEEYHSDSPEPPILTIVPPSPMPTSNSPFRKSISCPSESDKQTTTSEEEEDHPPVAHVFVCTTNREHVRHETDKRSLSIANPITTCTQSVVQSSSKRTRNQRRKFASLKMPSRNISAPPPRHSYSCHIIGAQDRPPKRNISVENKKVNCSSEAIGLLTPGQDMGRAALNRSSSEPPPTLQEAVSSNSSKNNIDNTKLSVESSPSSSYSSAVRRSLDPNVAPTSTISSTRHTSGESDTGCSPKGKL